MKKTITLILMLCLAIAVLGNGSTSYAEVGEKPYIKEIKVRVLLVKCRGHLPVAIGCLPEYYYTETIMSDQTIAKEEQYKDMNWKVERYDNVSKTYTLIETSEGKSFSFWLPYGTKEGQYKITATSKVDPTVSGYKWTHMTYSNRHKNFCIFQKGSVKYGEIKGEEPGPGEVKESYNPENKLYTSIVPKCPYTTKDYTFAGWKTKGKLYQPGEKFVASRNDYRHVYFQAQWKPNFKEPQLVANKAGKNKINLKWNRMIGGNGYKIYRATIQNGKYKLVGTVKDKWKTVWTDNDIQSGKIYYYRVAAYKKLTKKIILQKSAWAMASTKAAKVKSVKLSKTSVQGKVGQSTRMKATVKTTKGGNRLSKNVRWYTSDKKIVKVNQKTGKITFVKAGTCKVWAKSYSGKNSPKAKVMIVK